MTVTRVFGASPLQHGFSLIEQIMVLVIAALLTGIAVPSLQHLLGRNQLRVAQTDFIAALRHARGMAIASGRRTLFCPSPDGRHCSGGTRWDDGWLLAHDANGDHQPDGDPFYTGAAYSARLDITSSSGRHDVRFMPDGSASGSNVTLLFCESGSDTALSVVVSNAGRIRGAAATPAQAANCTQAE
ncbi:MAG TPA: GspH/FimT family pseudopilin [Rhodanobacter sp.]|nr:GspH/FimT family pseudopilin [Rhodanobacter sp.]